MADGEKSGYELLKQEGLLEFDHIYTTYGVTEHIANVLGVASFQFPNQAIHSKDIHDHVVQKIQAIERDTLSAIYNKLQQEYLQYTWMSQDAHKH